jgi:hypothetical protein
LLAAAPAMDLATAAAFENERLREAHYSAIGQVAAAWSYFEGVLDFWLLVYAGLEVEIGACFTGQMLGSRPRVEGFIALARYLGAAKRWNEPLEMFAKDVQALSEQRNRAVHDVWDMHLPSSPLRFEISAKRVVRVLQIHVPTQELLHLVRNINVLGRRFEDLASPIWGEIRALLGTDPPSTAP